MPNRYSVNYEIRDKEAKLMDYMKECEASYFVQIMIGYIESPEFYEDEFDQEDLEYNDSFPKILEIVNSNMNEADKEEKITDIYMNTNEWDYYMETYDANTYFGYTDLNDKYLLLNRYLIAFKIALSEIDPAPSLTEEGVPNVLDSYLKWLEDLYKEINPKSKVPELSKDMLEDLNFGIPGMMGSAEYAFGTYESDYKSETESSFFLEEAHPSSRFDFKPNNEVSFKSRMKDIFLNENIFYAYDWGLS